MTSGCSCSLASPALRRLASAHSLRLVLRLPRPKVPPFAAASRMTFSSSPSSASAALPRLPLFRAIAQHEPASTAVIHSLSGRTFTYANLLGDVRRARDRLWEGSGRRDMDGERIAFLVENSYDYVVILLAILASRSIAVPLSPAFPAPELEYILNHSESSLLVSSPKFSSKAKEALSTTLTSPPTHVQIPKHTGNGNVSSPREDVPLEGDDPGGAGLMLYTSGTTNRPKGVLLPQAVLTAQATSLQQAWSYTASDHLLHVLPLHHIHGVVNAILTPLFAGSSIEFMFPFNPDTVWRRLAAPFLPSPDCTNDNLKPPAKPKITFFTVVPTVYSRLLASHESLPPDVQQAAKEAISPSNLRVNISGSAALPTPIKKAWTAISNGNVLLERYGMTEVGMALSCGLAHADRVDASVGWPLPSVQARLVDLDSEHVIPPSEQVDSRGRERAGEIQLRGPTVFREYWRNPSATASEFVPADDGAGPWFKTGDVAVRRVVPAAGRNADAQPWAKGPMYFIQGRKSADIIKTGGEKVSALEVERELLSLPQVAEAAVVALPSRTWGQKVGAVVVLRSSSSSSSGSGSDSGSGSEGKPPKKWSALDMRRALKPALANYKIPQAMKVVDHIPRNAMGKINKTQLAHSVFSDEFSDEER